MLETYTDFMIFEVKDTGEYLRLNITENKFRQNNGNAILHPLQVIIIVKEELRRIYLWKGISSTVRRKFIASRAASEIQKKLINSSKFHRCKIISVDQGDEPTEFLNTFGFNKIPVIVDNEIHMETDRTNSESISYNKDNRGKEKSLEHKKNEVATLKSSTFPSYGKLKRIQRSDKILERVLTTAVPVNFSRKNILIGNNILFGEILKKSEVFNNHFVEKDWEKISKFPRDVVEIDGAKLRFHINKDLGEIDAIEILEKLQDLERKRDNSGKLDYEKWTVKQLRQYCRDKSIKIPSSYRKADIIRLVIEHTES
ncbi:MAG: hypothetical protein ACFFD7_08110 [Candidatus Thorarchaeota archaeon]